MSPYISTEAFNLESARRLVRGLEQQVAETPCLCNSGRIDCQEDCPRHGDDGPAERLAEARYDLDQLLAQDGSA